MSRKYGIDAIFFDGRGVPPSRGGGKTHSPYASMGKNISNKNIELTIQGQTVSSNFGTVECSTIQYGATLNAGVSNDLFAHNKITFTEEEEKLLAELSEACFGAYKASSGSSLSY